MRKRINIYLQEMYPVFPRLFLGFLLFFEVYFLLILNHGVKTFYIGISEVVGSITVFCFLLILRIADDFKDYETDLILFPERTFPSGRIKKNDLIVLLTTAILIPTVLNLIFMNNIWFFILLFTYGTLMSLWFFQKHRIQKNLLLALVTHNPVQFILNLYILSFACIKYDLPLLNPMSVLVAFTLYWPALMWEMSRKIKAPEDETDYTTYSKIFGHKKATLFLLCIMFIDMITTSLLVGKLFPVAVLSVVLSYLWLVFNGMRFIKEPTKFRLITKVERYIYFTELSIVVILALYIILGK